MTEAKTRSQSAIVATYHARFELDQSGVWIVELEELPEVHSYGRTLGKAREYISDALALWLDIPVTEARQRIKSRTPELPESVKVSVDHALAEREIADATAKVASEAMTVACVSLLRDAHLSMRDAAEVLGISHQRVQQLSSSRQLPIGVTPAPQVKMDMVRSLREFLPGGSKQDLGAFAAMVTLALAVVWVDHETSVAR